jgi:hypothetical protein
MRIAFLFELKGCIGIPTKIAQGGWLNREYLYDSIPA